VAAQTMQRDRLFFCYSRVDFDSLRQPDYLFCEEARSFASPPRGGFAFIMATYRTRLVQNTQDLV
jgi:hypothetical protein